MVALKQYTQLHTLSRPNVHSSMPQNFSSTRGRSLQRVPTFLHRTPERTLVRPNRAYSTQKAHNTDSKSQLYPLLLLEKKRLLKFCQHLSYIS
jgi:hypothetical protein